MAQQWSFMKANIWKSSYICRKSLLWLSKSASKLSSGGTSSSKSSLSDERSWFNVIASSSSSDKLYFLDFFNFNYTNRKIKLTLQLSMLSLNFNLMLHVSNNKRIYWKKHEDHRGINTFSTINHQPLKLHRKKDGHMEIWFDTSLKCVHTERAEDYKNCERKVPTWAIITLSSHPSIVTSLAQAKANSYLL